MQKRDRMLFYSKERKIRQTEREREKNSTKKKQTEFKSK